MISPDADLQSTNSLLLQFTAGRKQGTSVIMVIVLYGRGVKL
jgi:hypothetical protein